MKKLVYIYLFLCVFFPAHQLDAQITSTPTATPVASETTVPDEVSPSPADIPTATAAPGDGIDIPIPRPTDILIPTETDASGEPATDIPQTPTPTAVPTSIPTPSPTTRAVPAAIVRPPRGGIRMPPLSFFTRQSTIDYYTEQPISRTETILLMVLALTLFVWSMILLIPNLPVILLNRLGTLLFPRILRKARIISYDHTL